MEKIVALVGSLRKDSYNLQLVQSMQERYQDKFGVEIADLRSLPHFDQDEEQHPAESVVNFKRTIADAEGVFIVTPEFNWSIPGVLKNALDWVSRVDRVLVDKPVLIAGVSQGMLGTIRAQLHLREILASPGVAARLFPVGGNEILINFAGQKFDASGRLVDAPTLAFIDDVMNRFTAWMKK